MTEQNYSHREGVEKQPRENRLVSVVLDFTFKKTFCNSPKSFHQNSTVHQFVNEENKTKQNKKGGQNWGYYKIKIKQSKAISSVEFSMRL